MGASELPAALLFPHLRRRLGSRGTLVLSIVFMAIKPLLFWLTPSLGWVLAVQPVQMPGVRPVHARIRLLRQRKRLSRRPGPGTGRYDDGLQRTRRHGRKSGGRLRHRSWQRQCHAGTVHMLRSCRRSLRAGSAPAPAAKKGLTFPFWKEYAVSISAGLRPGKEGF